MNIESIAENALNLSSNQNLNKYDRKANKYKRLDNSPAPSLKIRTQNVWLQEKK